MAVLQISPHSGINRRFPHHKLTSDKKQYVRDLWNYISLDGTLKTVAGATRYASSANTGYAQWAKRLYYLEGGDAKRVQYTIMDGIFYKGHDTDGTLVRVPVDNKRNIECDKTFFPISEQFKASGVIVTYLVDGTSFFKLIPNQAGNWEKLGPKTDLDGNTIRPTFVSEWLDRLWVLDKERNVLLGSNNLGPETFDDADDSVLIELPPGNGGFPRALIRFRGYLYVIHDDYFVPVSGSSPATFGVKPGDVIYGFGTNAPRSVVNLKTTFGFLNSTDNEYYLTGGTLDSTMKTPLSYDIKLSELLNYVKADQTVAHLDTKLNCIRIAYVPAGEAVLNSEEIYSLDEEKWCGQTRNRKISCYCQWNGPGDNNELITGRSDAGLLMINDRGHNFDGNPQRYRLVTADYGDDYLTQLQFQNFWVDAVPFGRTTMPLSYYLDARLTTRGQENVDMQGEIFNLGLIEIGEQTAFLSRVVPFIDRSKGRMIRFESDETVADTGREIFSIFAEYEKEEVKTTKYIHGA